MKTIQQLIEEKEAEFNHLSMTIELYKKMNPFKAIAKKDEFAKKLAAKQEELDALKNADQAQMQEQLDAQEALKQQALKAEEDRQQALEDARKAGYEQALKEQKKTVEDDTK